MLVVVYQPNHILIRCQLVNCLFIICDFFKHLQYMFVQAVRQDKDSFLGANPVHGLRFVCLWQDLATASQQQRELKRWDDAPFHPGRKRIR